MKNKLFLTIAFLIFSAFANAEPILVFSQIDSRLLLGVNNVALNGEIYDVKFGPGIATIFADQESATAASNALVEQVFTSQPFLSLNLNGIDPNLPGTWLGKSKHERGQYLQVSQFWGDVIYWCPDGVSPPSGPCIPRINQSIIELSPTHEPSTIVNKLAVSGYLYRCGDCGAMETLWIKTSNVVEPGTLGLFLIPAVAVALRRKRIKMGAATQ